jgi:hypothetical protein
MKYFQIEPRKPVLSNKPPLVDPPTLPSHIECPKCGAAPGYGCHSPSGYVARGHRERWEAVGILDLETRAALYQADYAFIVEHRRNLLRQSYDRMFHRPVEKPE